jgi:thymidine phosphorylase
LRETGVVIAAAGPGLAPADRRLYALRDVTGTVESIPLIASSIMSKKIAEAVKALVLDVKTGSGAFMKGEDEAVDLARVMTALGEEHGVRTSALVTRMDTPLGRAVGNALEVEEASTRTRGRRSAAAAPTTPSGRWSPPRAATRTPRCPRPRIEARPCRRPATAG